MKGEREVECVCVWREGGVKGRETKRERGGGVKGERQRERERGWGIFLPVLLLMRPGLTTDVFQSGRSCLTLEAFRDDLMSR